MALKRVVVTGLGALTPLGNTVPEFWESLKNGVSGSDLITHFDASKFKTRFACEVKNFNVENFIDRKEARRLDRYAQFALVTADEAIKDSGLDLTKVDPDEAGVVWASGIGGIKTFEEEVFAYVKGDGTPKFSPFFIPKMIADIAAGHISMKYNFRGPNFCTVSACASSSHAIIEAYVQIQLGKAKIMITGGSEASITEASIGGFNAMQALSTNNDEYKTASRPFCKTRDGFVMGEGAAALVLEEYEYAVARGAKIYAEIVGTGLTADAYHLTAPHPEGLGAKKVMEMAIKEAKISPTEVDYINVHGTATPLGDVAELKAIQQVFGEHAYNLNISSTKSMHGHLLGGAGAIEALATILAIVHNTAPPTINHKEYDENIDPKLNLTLHKAQERTIHYALSNTFGFGGHNACILFKKHS
ncbi:MAG: beta-ketoacyl-ACP synthase II [Bacteroidales bacterium]|nr:beta-ketoacyl-ACP synthase II [Bacteroidales bacterium]